MLRKLAALTFLLVLVPTVVLGQDNSSSNYPNRELIINGLTLSDKVGNVDRFLSAEFRWGVNDEPEVVLFHEKNKKPTLRFVPGVEFEYLKGSAVNDDVLVRRYSELVWLKGYLTFKPKRKLRPYLGGAIGVDNEYIEANLGLETEVFIRNFGFRTDLLSGIHYYYHNKIVLSVATKLWRPSLNFGAGFTF